MEEYVDITSEKWTKRWKIYALIRVGIKWSWAIMCGIVLIVVFEVMAPYITGDEIWEDLPWTLSQLEAIISVSVIAYIMTKASKGL